MIVTAFLLNIFLFALQPELIPEKEIPAQADFFAVDPLENIFLIKGSQVQKLEHRANKKKNYSSLIFGKITSVDVSNPFKILIFYKDFNKIEFLDNNLSLMASTVSLDDLGYYHVTAACSSVNGGFWLFDQSLNQISYIDQDLNTVQKSSILTDIIGQNTGYEAVSMLEKNDYIYLGIKDQGVLLFDNYGTYIKTFPIKSAEKFQIINDHISYLNDGNLYFYNLDNYNETHIKLPKPEIKQAIIENGKLYIQSESVIYIYQLKNF